MAQINHKTISKGRKTIVFGMSWYAVEENESPRKAGISLARSIPAPFDLIAVRKGQTPQFGLASTSEGAKSGCHSAAAIVADLVNTESWLYVLEIESSVWICAGREGYILPGGDRIHETRPEARRAFHDFNPSSFKKVYLPASWKANNLDEDDEFSADAGDTEETDILDFIENPRPGWGQLSPVSPLGIILKSASILMLAGSVAISFNFIMNTRERTGASGPTPAEIRAARDRLKQEQKQERLERWAELDANRPWHKAVPADEILEACLDGIQDLPARPVGYDISRVLCDGQQIEAEISRTSGYTSWLREWAQDYDNVETSLSPNGNEGILISSIPDNDARGDEKISTFQEASQEFLENGQIDGASINLSNPAAAVVPSEPDYTPYYAVSDFSMETRRPLAWCNFFSQTPGLTITEVVLDTQNHKYSIQGELHVRNF